MKKLLLTLIYPIWFFFSSTWLGNALMIFVCIFPIPLILNILFPELLDKTGEEAGSIGIGVVLISLLFAPYVAIFFFRISSFLKESYVKWNYKIEMDYKMGY